MQHFHKCFTDYGKDSQALQNLPFPGGKVSYEKHKKRWISLTPFNRFLTNFHNNDRTVSDHLMHVTDDLENVCQGKNLKNYHFWGAIFLKKSQRQISLMVTGNQKIPRISYFGVMKANDHRLRFQQFFSVFPLFPGRVETKKC